MYKGGNLKSLNLNSRSFGGFGQVFGLKLHIFSSPEPKAHGELIVYQSSRRLFVCPCICSQHDYLHNQQAYSNQILSEASLGWGIGCIKFWARSDWNSGFHGNG